MKDDNQFALVVKQSGLDVESPKAKALLEQFSDYFDIAADWEAKAKVIVVTDASQTGDMKMAREGRLFLREKRIAIEKKRKELKEQSLREGKAIDGMANILKALIVPIEEHLKKQEDFVEIKRAEEAERLRIEAEKKAEEECLAKEKAEAKERERIGLENERLKKEAEEKERALQAERSEFEEERIKQEKMLADEKKGAEFARQKAVNERVRIEVAHKKEQEALEAKLKTLITCPYCGGKLYPDGSKPTVTAKE